VSIVTNPANSLILQEAMFLSTAKIYSMLPWSEEERIIKIDPYSHLFQDDECCAVFTHCVSTFEQGLNVWYLYEFSLG
jgi:hypothetical protein